MVARGALKNEVRVGAQALFRVKRWFIGALWDSPTGSIDVGLFCERGKC